MPDTFRPHPFRWVPGDGRRHATTHRSCCQHEDTEIETLCGRHVLGDNSVLAWLWPTCPECDRAAHELAGVPLPTHTRHT